MKTMNYVSLVRERFEQWLSESNLPAGAKLPSERELCELLDTKRMTLRQVLIELEVESRIFRKNRSGWFITPSKFIYNPKCLSSFNEEALAQGRKPFWDYLDKTRVDNAPTDVAALFSADSHPPIQKITGWCGLDAHKVFYHESYINTHVAPDYIEQLSDQSFAALWQAYYGQQLTIQKLAFKPVNMPPEACKELGVAPNSFGILIEKHRANEQKQVVHIDFEYWRFESVELVINDL
ncbi:transcriptional regulator [Photobacterium aphoticum]|nr:UTRA domain-containing protein [Photobacterium aphoticum]GHA45922.1 transcriptional regulator [Photobacterium aphoticum]